MKKIILMAVAVMMVAATASAQKHKYYDTKHEVEVGMGVGTNTQIVYGLARMSAVLGGTLVSAIVTGGTVVAYESHSNEKDIPAINVGYYYHLNKVIAVGGFASYNGIKYDVNGYVQYNTSDPPTKKLEKIGTSRFHNITLMPSAKFHWVRTKHFGFYSKLGVGATVMAEDVKSEDSSKNKSDSELYFNFNCIPIGLDAGSEHIRGFVEIGAGEQGIMAAGLRYKF